MPTTLTNGIQLPDKGSVDWYGSMQSNYNLIDTHLGDTDTHVTAEDKANWNSKQGSLSQAQLDAIAQVATNTNDIATLQSGKADASHTHSSSDITDIGDYATKQYVDNSISGLVDNAPDALNTLNELSAALNDDSNFASTVTTALSAKANSADLATVATSGDYDDLSNKPSIPTNTSDLNNDSNFVDTSNPAVSSGITAAKVTDYDGHIADTDIHVTTADKTKWNNGVSQSYVLRYSSSSVTDNSTIAYSTLDNTDNIKASDKVIDVDGKIFSVVSVDTANQTVTVGSALIDLALDSGVMHLSGDETADGQKTFNNVVPINGVYIGNEPSTTFRTVLLLRSRYDTVGKSGWLVSKFRSNSAQGALSGSDIVFLNFDVLENEVRTNGILRFNLSSWSGNTPGRFSLIPSSAIESYLGTSGNKWSAINGLNPSSLSLPDLSNGIDISSYIPALDSGNTQGSYTPSVNGFIVFRGVASTGGCSIVQGNMGNNASYITDPQTSNKIVNNFLPVIKDNPVVITVKGLTSIESIYFYPCQGNV